MWINNSFVQVRRQSVLDIRIASHTGDAVLAEREQRPRKAQPGITNEEDLRVKLWCNDIITWLRECFGDLEHKVQSRSLKMHENPFVASDASMRPVYMFPDECQSTSSVSTLKLHHNGCVLFSFGHAGTQMNSRDFDSKFSLPRVSHFKFNSRVPTRYRQRVFFLRDRLPLFLYSTVGWISSSFSFDGSCRVLANICHFYRKAVGRIFFAANLFAHTIVCGESKTYADSGYFFRYQWRLLAQAVNHGLNCFEFDRLVVIIAGYVCWFKRR